MTLFNRLFESFKDTEDGINEKGWDRALSKPSKPKVRKFSAETEPGTKQVNIKIFPTHRVAIKTNRAIDKLKDLRK